MKTWNSRLPTSDNLLLRYNKIHALIVRLRGNRLDDLRSKQETANIPVIVATAKELTVDEKGRLQGQIQSLMMKGDFLNDEFLDEVRSLIR